MLISYEKSPVTSGVGPLVHFSCTTMVAFFCLADLKHFVRLKLFITCDYTDLWKAVISICY